MSLATAAFVFFGLTNPTVVRAQDRSIACARALYPGRPSFIDFGEANPEARLRAAAVRTLANLDRGDADLSHELWCVKRDDDHVVDLHAAIKRIRPHLILDRGAPLALGRVIHALRAVEALDSPEIQRRLQVVVTDRVERAIRRAVARARDVRGREPGYPLAEVMATDLARFTQAFAVFDADGAEVFSESSRPLTTALLFEVITNANKATFRRHRTDQTVVRVRDGDQVSIEIEDFGDPAEYARTKGVGRSYPARYGVGIGRLRAYLLADFMGFSIDHRAKGDGSGSVVTLRGRPAGARTAAPE